MLCQNIGIFYYSESPRIMILIVTFSLVLSLVSCTKDLMLNLYFSEDNKVLITFPVNSNVIFLSKLIVFYFYEIKKNDTSKANGGIGIIPYVYNDAFNYYYAIWEAQQKNTEKVLSDYTIETQEVFIPIPQRKIKKRELFTFLDEGEDINVK